MVRDNGNAFFCILKGVGIALAVSFLSVVVFACVLRVKPCSEKTVYFVNQTIKTAAILFATLCTVRGEKGWLKGVVIGALFVALSYLTFSVVGGDFSLSLAALGELAVGLLVGGVAGAIAVNLK